MVVTGFGVFFLTKKITLFTTKAKKKLNDDD
jgi:hypothetical protein